MNQELSCKTAICAEYERIEHHNGICARCRLVSRIGGRNHVLVHSQCSFFSASNEKQDFENAQQRMVLVTELNRHIGEAFGVAVAAALSDNEPARQRGLHEATDRIDTILSELSVARGLELESHRDALLGTIRRAVEQWIA